MGIPITGNWRDVVGYEGLYSVSDEGQVWSHINNRLRKLVFNKGNGYMMLFLVDLKGGKKCVYAHRLVAMAFVDRQQGKDVVNHIDENKTNNFASNIEWCTKQYNNTYNDKLSANKKQVAMISLGGVVAMVFESAREASRTLGIEYKNISACCLGKRNLCGGYAWRFIEKTGGVSSVSQ